MIYVQEHSSSENNPVSLQSYWKLKMLAARIVCKSEFFTLTNNLLLLLRVFQCNFSGAITPMFSFQMFSF